MSQYPDRYHPDLDEFAIVPVEHPPRRDRRYQPIRWEDQLTTHQIDAFA